MENRERDRVSQRRSPTEAGELNRQTEEEKGRERGSSIEFGKNIGRSEEGMGSESSRRSDSSWNDTGRSGSSSGRH